MKAKETAVSSSSVSSLNKGDCTKLASLLTLAAGAFAVPQTTEADIIVTDLGANPGHVGYLYSQSFVISMPGTAKLGFNFIRQGFTSSTSARFVTAAQVGGQYMHMKTMAYGNNFLLVHVPAGVNWNNAPGTHYRSATAGVAIYNAHLPNGYNHEYMLFKFQDSTQGNAVRYGWADISLNNGNLSSSEGPDLTIWRYAYDNTGAQILSGDVGQVPEPSSVALLALGALALGANGIRAWRRNGASAEKP